MTRSHLTSRRLTTVAATAATLLAFSLIGPPSAHSFTRGITDDVYGDTGPIVWVHRTQASGARLVLLAESWVNLEPSHNHYEWGGLDQVVREFEGTPLQLVVNITDAPAWAETHGGPAAFESDGAWKPSPTAYGQFARALAQRYSGSTPDPLRPGHNLPRLRYYQAWAEANFSIHLAPQWTKVNGHWVNTGADIYRVLLNAFYSAVKSVNRKNIVVASGLGPYGDPSPGTCTNKVIGVGPGCRTAPMIFAKRMLCLSGTGCSASSHFNVYAIDPYEAGSPTTHAPWSADISLPDLPRYSRLFRKAQRAGHTPGGRKHLWVTEFSYQSSPPNPYAVSTSKQARWLEESLYIMWRENVQDAIWYLIRDQAAKYSPDLWFSGLYTYSGKPKPAQVAYHFPFVVMSSGRSATAWGISPAGGEVLVQRRAGSGWRTLFRKHVSGGSVFSHRIAKSLKGSFRAVVGGESSLIWHR